MTDKLQGVIAAIATAVDEAGEPDCARSTALARFLLANGCDALNVFGTTGEATSFSLEQRKRVMTAYGDAALPLDRLMVGTGAAAVADAVTLTRHAAELGFAGALLLPPFYYKGVPDDGLAAYVATIVQATAARPIPIYLYHFPSQSGLPWRVELIRRLLDEFGARIVGLKDSSGDMAYAREAASIAATFKVFPSTEAVLMEARTGVFAGCISATANVNAAAIDRLYRGWRGADADRQQESLNAVRKTVGQYVMIPALKQVIAYYANDPEWVTVRPPLTELTAAQAQQVIEGLRQLGFNMPGIERAATKSAV
jgi:4-hydroxy-tetrahydrodipicolinate synthase